MYNKYFKIAAALLVGIIFAACGSLAANGIISIESRRDSVYRFEPSFGDSHYIREKLSEPIWAVANAYLYVENYMGENDIVIDDNISENETESYPADEDMFKRLEDGETTDTADSEPQPTELPKESFDTQNGEATDNVDLQPQPTELPQERGSTQDGESENTYEENNDGEENSSVNYTEKNKKTITTQELRNMLNEKIEKNLSNADDEAVNYYIVLNGENYEKIYANSDVADKSQFLNSEHYVTFNYNDNRETQSTSCSNSFDFPWVYGENELFDDVTIYVMVKPQTASYVMAEWLHERNEVMGYASEIGVLLLVMLLLLVYLIIVCGKEKGSDKIKLMKIDYMFSEIQPIILIAAAVSGTAVCIFFIEYALFSYIPVSVVVAGVAVIAGVFGFIFEGLVLSWARNIKNKTLIKHSLTYRIFCFLKKCYIKLKSHLKNAKSLSKIMHSEKIGVIITSGLIGYTLLLCIFAHLSIILVIVLLAAVWYFISRKFAIFDELRRAISEIKNGNIEYKIDRTDSGILGLMCEDVNMIRDGIKKSVEHEVRAERMKTELITNVSHDLKTPLTSIINYAELLNKENLTPSEANDYVKIIMSKSQRLKNLTQDLFDISKVQSGNENFNIEKIDVSMLLKQVLGENDKEIKKTSLDFKTNIEDEVYVMADGKKLARVFENLINNILKYSMEHTRVYISLKKNDKAEIEFKNISSYQMDFDEDEITERFIRGDESRSREGSGLGLAIAKSYIEAFGGSLKVRTDGDLFKVIINL